MLEDAVQQPRRQRRRVVKRRQDDASEFDADRSAPLPEDDSHQPGAAPAFLLPSPTSSSHDALLDASPPLTTQPPTELDAAGRLLVLVKRDTVVTITATQTNADTGSNAGLSPQPQTTLPLGIIIGSVAVGVVLAVGLVLGYVCWGRRAKRRHVYNRNVNPNHKTHGNSSTTRLALQTSTSPRSLTSPATSPGDEKRPLSAISKRDRSSSLNAIPTLVTTPTPPSRTHHHKGPPSPRSTGKKPDLAISQRPKSPEEELGELQPNTPNSARVRSYVPQKRSPLAMGAEPRTKAAEKPKVNEWARPLSPTSPTATTKSSSHGHEWSGGDKTSGEDFYPKESAKMTPVSSLGSSARTAVDTPPPDSNPGYFAIPSNTPANHPPSSWQAPTSGSLAPGARTASRTSQLSNDSYYTSEEQMYNQYANMPDAGDDVEVRQSTIGMALGGDELSPDPTQQDFRIPPPPRPPGLEGQVQGGRGSPSGRTARQ